MSKKLTIAGKTFNSRLFVGTGKFGSLQTMRDAILASGSELVTVALKRVDYASAEDDLLTHLKAPHINLLPNTSGARDAKEAVFAACMAREAMQTNWVKLEIHPDAKYLLPDPIETLQAAAELVKLGFIVLPYIHADPILCKKLEDVGVAAVMPLGSPIGSNKGLVSFFGISTERSNCFVCRGPVAGLECVKTTKLRLAQQYVFILALQLVRASTSNIPKIRISALLGTNTSLSHRAF